MGYKNNKIEVEMSMRKVFDKSCYSKHIEGT